MPKFISHVVAVEKRGKDGSVIKSGEVVVIPVDDAAMLEPIAETAVVMGLVKKPDGTPYTMEEFQVRRKEIQAMFDQREREANKRRAVL